MQADSRMYLSRVINIHSSTKDSVQSDHFHAASSASFPPSSLHTSCFSFPFFSLSFSLVFPSSPLSVLLLLIYRQNILQFVTKYGEVVSFRFHFKAGTERAEPRGYCFAEFSTREVGCPLQEYSASQVHYLT